MLPLLLSLDFRGDGRFVRSRFPRGGPSPRAGRDAERPARMRLTSSAYLENGPDADRCIAFPVDADSEIPHSLLYRTTTSRAELLPPRSADRRAI